VETGYSDSSYVVCCGLPPDSHEVVCYMRVRASVLFVLVALSCALLFCSQSDTLLWRRQVDKVMSLMERSVVCTVPVCWLCVVVLRLA
jgi:hypothetical protein